MIRRLYPVIITIPLFLVAMMQSSVSRADFFGGDLPILAQILTQATQEVLLLQQTLQVAKGESDILKDANRDIQAALTEIQALQDIVRETTDIGKIRNPLEIVNRLRDVYGRLPKIGDVRQLELNDRVAATGLGVDNDTYLHADKIDAAAINYQRQARKASPGKAQQVTAQSQSTVLHALAQIERDQGTAVRVASSQLALQNSQAKAKIESFDQSYSGIITSVAAESTDLKLGRLE